MYRIVLNETSYYGAGCRSVIADEIRKRGFKKVLLVTDKDLIRFGVAAKIEEVLRGADIPYEIYSQIKANPTIRNVQQGVEAFKASGADCMVALGGGSSIDTAKAVGIIVNNPEFADVRSLEGVADTKHRAVPTFAVPTTAGTAAAQAKASRREAIFALPGRQREQRRSTSRAGGGGNGALERAAFAEPGRARGLVGGGHGRRER